MIRLSSDSVHIWRAALDQPASRMKKLEQTLSEDELARAGRFHFEQDRKRFIAGRGILRAILGLYLSVDPGRLQFRYGSYGKPCLSCMVDRKDGALRFNLAHSHELALYAVSIDREIGVDLEYIRHIPDIEQIAARFFSASENAVLDALPASQKLEAFFNCWTLKEAYIKAIGNGLAHPLDQFGVSLAPGEPARLLNVEGHPEEVSRWTLKTLVPIPGYAAALAVEGDGWQLQDWQYEKAYELAGGKF